MWLMACPRSSLKVCGGPSLWAHSPIANGSRSSPVGTRQYSTLLHTTQVSRTLERMVSRAMRSEMHVQA